MMKFVQVFVMLAAFICTATARPVQQQSQKLKQLRALLQSLASCKF